MSHSSRKPALSRAAAAITAAMFASSAAFAGPMGYASPEQQSPFEQVLRDGGSAGVEQDATEIPTRLRRQMVGYQTSEVPGTIVIDTPNTQLYYVLGGGKAIRYGIGVGREGFTWSGVQTVTRKTEWPDWHPPQEMIERQPYLPRFMAGGPNNPLGARAMYLGGTVYRIHGTNAPDTIGRQVSSGCIRLLNEDVVDLYSRVNLGTKVVVLPVRPRPDTTAHNIVTPQARPVMVSSRPIRPFGVY